MRHPRKWEEMNCPPRPLAFAGWPAERVKPSSFPWKLNTFPCPGDVGKAFLFYHLGWTAIVFWNARIYFADEVLTFDGMMELIRARFPEKFHLQAPVVREYVD